MRTILTLLWVWAAATVTVGAAEFPAPRFVGDPARLGYGVQRTMRRLVESTPTHRNTVRVLFYGQSITDQAWWKIVAEDLRARFPNANLIIENRSLPGFASQLLVKTAETDLYPFQPDLLIFHVYGAHDKYEDIIRRVRERTTAEILLQNDHVTKPPDFTEETDPAKLPPAGRHWDAFMNHNWLPAMARKYGAELCDQRAVWKAYLRDNQLAPSALLRDDVHLNAHGEFLMAECVKACLRRNPAFDPAPAEAWVRTLAVGRELQWADGKLRVEFTGNRVDLIARPAASAGRPLGVTLDGRKPSQIPELYGFTRALTTPPGKWPVRSPIIAPVGAEKPLVVEEWTLAVRRTDAEGKHFTFQLSGSRTGPDGEGRSDERFISPSGRVVLEPADWNVAYAMSLSGVQPVPEQFTARWRAELRGVDEWTNYAGGNPAMEESVTLAQGLPNTRHVLELTGGPEAGLAGVRVYHPAGGER